MVQRRSANNNKWNPAESAYEIEQIRDILLGSIMHDYEARLTRLEQTIETRLSEFQEAFAIQASGLERRIKSHTDHMTQSLEQEKEALDNWRQELDATLQQLGERLVSASVDRRQLAALLTTLAAQIEQRPASNGQN
jgi:phage host-nuclease inhibitor protein Gam